jgi:hypothetical protein
MMLQHEMSFCRAREVGKRVELRAGDALPEIFPASSQTSTRVPFSQCSMREPRVLTRAMLNRPAGQQSVLSAG